MKKLTLTSASIRDILPLIIIALVAGALVTALAWLRIQGQLLTAAFWVSIVTVVGAGLLIKYSMPFISKTILLLAVFAGVSLVYLFPELFSPGCNGMPKAFAACPASCQISTCSNWVPEGGTLPNGNKCVVNNPWDLGCCTSYTTTCDPDCNDPGGGGGGPTAPTITAALACADPGSGGWCQAGQTLNLTATDPQGYNILVSAVINGTTYTCPIAAGTVNCSLNLPEGSGTASFTATSSPSGLTHSGTQAWKLDSIPPGTTTNVTPAVGAGGWITSSPATFTGSASDGGSGPAGVACTLDGVARPSCTISVSANGPHTVVMQASDLAGNTSQATRSFSIDTQAPSLTAGLSGTNGANGWYTYAQLNASASDATPGSGLKALEYALDGGAWTTFPGAFFAIPDGKHTLDARAVDNAGLITQATQVTAWVDSTKPTLSVTPAGTAGSNGWYISSVQISASASDTVSGLNKLEYSLDGGATWEPYTSPLTFTDGTHAFSFYAEDKAGQSVQIDQTVKVDTHAPAIGGSLANVSGGSPVSGTNGWYISTLRLSALAADPSPASGISSFTYILDGGAETAYSAPLTLTDGQHSLVLNARDEAGLTSSLSQTLKVDTFAPTLSISTVLPEWIQDSVTLNGSSNDATSGLLKVEVSTNGGASWSTAAGTTSWSYLWNTASAENGAHSLRVRAVDSAGLSTQSTLNTQVDNQPPSIALPADWQLWDTVTFDAWDQDSGLAGAEIVISDPQDRWPKRRLLFEPGQLPVGLLWDRRFGDGTVAPLGDYEVDAWATDRRGNAKHVTATIHISLAGAFFPAPPTATPLPPALPSATPTRTPTALPETPTPTGTPGGEDSDTFGTILPTAQYTPTATSTPVARPAPTQESFSSWLESIFLPPPLPADGETEIHEEPGPSLFAASQADAGTLSAGVLSGAAATAAIAAFAAAIAQKKREEEEAAAEAAARSRETAKLRRMDPDERAAYELKQAIAAVTQKEQKEWKAERYEQISKSDEYKNSENKTQFMHNQLAKIKDDEAYYRAEQKRKAEEEARKAAEELAAQQQALMEAQRDCEEAQAAAAAVAARLQAAADFEGDMSPTEKLALLKATPEYQAYVARMVAWEEQKKSEAAAKFIFGNAGYFGTGLLAAKTAYDYRGLTINTLDTGMVSVSAGNIPAGMRAEYFENLDIPLKPGGNYLEATVREGLMDGVTRGATNGLSWGIAGIGSAISNLYTFGHEHTSSFEDFAQATVGKQEFWVSTGVDTVISVAIGVGVAAAVVATAPVTLPAAAIAIGAGLLAIGVTALIYSTPAPDLIKSGINTVIDIVQSLPKTTPVHQAIPAPIAPTTSTLPVSSTPSPVMNSPQSSIPAQTVQAGPAQTPSTASPTSTPQP